MLKLLIKLLYGNSFPVLVNTYIDLSLLGIQDWLLKNNIFENIDQVREYLKDPVVGQLVILMNGTQLMYDIDHTWYLLNSNQQKTKRQYPHKCSNNNIQNDVEKNISGWNSYYYRY